MPVVKDLLTETFLLLATTAVFNLLFYLFEERPLTSSNLVEFENNGSGKMINSINLHRRQCKNLFLSETTPWSGYYLIVTHERHHFRRPHQWLESFSKTNHLAMLCAAKHRNQQQEISWAALCCNVKEKYCKGLHTKKRSSTKKPQKHKRLDQE